MLECFAASTTWELICCLPRDIWFLFSQTQLCYSSFILPYGVIRGEIETISQSSFTDEIVTDGFMYFSSCSSHCSCLELVATHLFCLLCVQVEHTQVKSVMPYYLSSDTSELRPLAKGCVDVLTSGQTRLQTEQACTTSECEESLQIRFSLTRDQFKGLLLPF